MGFHAFLKGISLKENVRAWLEFELAYYDAVQHVSLYTTGLPTWIITWNHIIICIR